jgi:hypothetical protein
MQTLTAVMLLPTVPWSLRTRCCRLIRTIYVDCDSFHHLNVNIHTHTHVWSGLSHLNSSEAIEGSSFAGFQDERTHVRELKNLLVALLREDRDEGSFESVDFPKHGKQFLLRKMSSMSSWTGENMSAMKGTDGSDIYRDKSEAAKKTSSFQAEFVTEIAKTIGKLLDFGFFYYLDHKTGQQMLDMPGVRECLIVLLNVLDSRRVPLGQEGSSQGKDTRDSRSLVSEALNQSFLSDAHGMLHKRNVEILLLCNRFLDFTLADTSAKVVGAWEALLSDTLKCPDLPTGMRTCTCTHVRENTLLHTRTHACIHVSQPSTPVRA